MKRLMSLLGLVVVFFIFPVWSVFAQSQAKTSLPQVPIAYSGDTNETIIRRAQWVEGAKKEGKLVWWGTLSPSLKERIIAEFNKLYPFIKVDHWRGMGEEIASKMEADFIGGLFSPDTIMGGEFKNFPKYRKMGMLEKFTGFIPGIEKTDKRNYSRYDDWVTPGHTVVTPQYNTALVSSTVAPKSWDDLLDPKWKGHIGISRDVKVWTVLAIAEGGWGIEKTESFLHKLAKQNLVWVAGHSAGHALMTAGEFKVGAEQYFYHVLTSQDKGAPVDWCRVNPVAVYGPSVILMKKARNPNAARLFLEWFFSPTGALIFDKITSEGSAFIDTRQGKLLKGLDFVVRTEEIQIKINELGLDEKFSKILGITQ